MGFAHTTAVQLSAALKQYPTAFDNTKISLVEKFITTISTPFCLLHVLRGCGISPLTLDLLIRLVPAKHLDMVPPKFRDIETLFLSNNSIRDLSCIAQFQKLRILSMANNCVCLWRAYPCAAAGLRLVIPPASLAEGEAEKYRAATHKQPARLLTSAIFLISFLLSLPPPPSLPHPSPPPSAQIDRFAEIERLAACPDLQILNLEYNPITQLPNYRLHVLDILPGLRLLDNKVLRIPQYERGRRRA